MTATQAPTPGPLSVGDRVVAIADLRQAPNGAVWIKEGEEAVIVREFGVNGCLVGVLTDEGHEGEWAKTCFRLAPTAPVEASGSELHPATADLVDRFAAELKSKLAKAESKYGYRDEWLKPDWQDELTKSLAEHIQKGDPRDVAAYCAFAWHHEWSVTPNINWKAEWEAVCSARIADRDRSQEIINERDAWIAELLQQAKVTTPARAEAQDEGAAGEREDIAREVWIGFTGNPSAWDRAKDSGNETVKHCWATADRILARAHPSPTPAADADRVREAIADVISHENNWRTALTAMDVAEETPEDGSGKPGYWLHQIKVLDRIVAALKAEGK